NEKKNDSTQAQLAISSAKPQRGVRVSDNEWPSQFNSETWSQLTNQVNSDEKRVPLPGCFPSSTYPSRLGPFLRGPAPGAACSGVLSRWIGVSTGAHAKSESQCLAFPAGGGRAYLAERRCYARNKNRRDI